MSCLLSFCDHYWYCFIFAVLWNIVHCVKVFDFVEVRSHIVWLLLLLNFVWAVSLFFPSFDNYAASFSIRIFYSLFHSICINGLVMSSDSFIALVHMSSQEYFISIERNRMNVHFLFQALKKWSPQIRNVSGWKKNEFNAKGKYPKRNSIKESNEETSE